MELWKTLQTKRVSLVMKFRKRNFLKKMKKGNGYLPSKESQMEELPEVIHSADEVNPFVLKQTLTIGQWTKVGILSVTLLPVRLLLVLGTLFLTWVLGNSMLLGTSHEQMQGKVPLTGWRRNFAKPLIARLARLMFWFGGWRWTVKGRRASPRSAPLLVVGPHSSFLDMAAVIALGCPGMVVKDTTADAPLFGSLIRFQQPVLVQREAADSRRQASQEIRRRTHSGEDWEQIIVFPEGGCGNRKAFLHFKLGAFMPGVAVQPVIIRYENELDTLTWTWDSPGALKQLWLTLTQFSIKGELEFLPAYHPTEHERTNPREFADNVQAYMSKHSGIPTTRFAVEDAPFIDVARSLELPPTAVMVKFLRLRKKIGRESVKPEAELEVLQENNNSLQNPEGDESYLASYIGTRRCPEVLRDFYALMDQNGKKCLDVRVYAACLCLIRTDLKAKDKLKAAFKVFGQANERQHLSAILMMWKGKRSLSSSVHSAVTNEKEETKNQCL